MQKIRRYPGVRPFENDDKDLFFGRDRDIDDLHDLIALERLTVLFGKSGYGKSSLINAGLLPKLSEQASDDTPPLLPLVVRLYSYDGTTASPIEKVLAQLAATASLTEGSSFLDDLLPEANLWYHFKRRQTPEKQRFLLIFDQFEEFFTYPLAQQVAFKTQLAELLYQDTPQSVRSAATQLDKAQRRFLAQALEVKVLFAIRADRMSLLDSMKDKLPAILQKRYELKGLTEAQAQEAITQPALLRDARFITPPFEYTRPALDKILSELSDNRNKAIEAFQVQIVCEEIEKEVEKGTVPDRDKNGLPDVAEENLPDFNNLYENYYRRKIEELTPSVRTLAQRILEDGLLAEDSATGEGRRMSVDSRALIAQFRQLGLTDDLLLALEKTYLIRREVNTVGGFSFEISHDTLVAPIQKMKSERRKKEAAERAEQERIDKELQLAAAKKQADVERKRRVLSNAALVAAMLGLAFAYWQYREAEKAKYLAEQEKNAALRSDSLTQVALREANSAKTKAIQSDSLAQEEKKTAQAQRDTAERKTREANAALAKVKIAEADKYIQSAKRLKDLDRALTVRILEAAQRLLDEAENLDKTNKEIKVKQLEINALK